MKTFWALLKESVILQAVLTLGIWGVLIYLVIVGRPIPDVVLGAASLVLGFYFGSKLAMSNDALHSHYQKRMDEKKVE